MKNYLLPPISMRCLAACAIMAMTANSAHADLITGVSIENVSSELTSFDRLAVHVLNGAGFEPNGPGTHSIVPNGTMWSSNGNFTTPNDLIGPYPKSYIEFDLEDNYNLDRFIVWNYNESGGFGDITNRGANLVNISVASSDVDPVFTSLGNFNFTRAPGNDTTSFGQLVDLSAFSAANDVRLVRFDVLSNHGGSNSFVGLSEVRFFVPDLANITSFEAAGATGVINQSAKTISLTVPPGTNLATLSPTFTLSSGVSNQTSGAPPSPTFAVQNPATYTVTDNSTDPATVKSYTVTVTVDTATTTLVIDLGSTPGTVIAGGTYIGSGPTNLPLPELPPGSILRSIAVNTTLVATDNGNFANDLTLLLDPTPETPGGDFSLGITGPAPAASFGPPTATLTWVGGAAGEGTPLVDTKTDADWAAAGVIDLATTGLFLGNSHGGPTVGGTWSGTITLTYDLVGAGSPYENWAGPGVPYDGDANGDGVANGLAFLFGASGPGVNALDKLPTVSENAGGLVLTFQMLDATARGTASLELEYSTTLATGSWTTVAVPDSSSTVDDVVFTITGTDPLDVTSTIPASIAPGGKIFARLKAEKP